MRLLLNYWHTLRYLKPVQFYGRMQLCVVRPRVDLRAAPPLRMLCGRDWVTPAHRSPNLLGPERFCFLNETHDLADHGWDDPALEKLWLYNLHYFGDLNASGASARSKWHRALLVRWVLENPPTVGTGWESYPTSLRIVNWIKWALNGNVLPSECVQSLAVQVRWLSRRLEFHLLGNHLFSNAKALVFAGLFFDGPEADAWLARGVCILEKEVREQILSDGGQFERSTMYHALALEDILDLCNVTTVFTEAIPARWHAALADWRERVDPMRDWLAVMSHPDCEISYFNDSAMGIAPASSELQRYAADLGRSSRPAPRRGITHLAASGYIRVEQGGAVAMLDVGRIGPDYIPGHAHADTLSFELSLFGQRVFVNSGTSCYGQSAERSRQRGTSAHNTVVVDGQDSSEMWAGFRVARRARPVGLEIETDGNIAVRCAHDGYRRLPGKVDHLRHWSFRENTLEVDDRIVGSCEHAEARFHLHPSIRLAKQCVTSSGSAETTLLLPQGQRVRLHVEGGRLREEAASWHPEFGRSEPSVCLVVELTCAMLRTSLGWERSS
ncbi:MAG: alginate lyase family protein [Acidobacteria bacterium]|nr:alginate lyase family protein [Acidobacteriota bacterium]